MSLPATERSNHSYREMPRYVRIILLAQAATILALTVAMYQVYLNDIYFQQYVISLFASNIIADASLSIVTASIFALGTFTLLGEMGTTRKLGKEWRLLSEQAKAAPITSMPVLEVVEGPLKPRSRSRRPRQRKHRVNTEKLYDSMRYFADDRRKE